jgi:predicted transcriptional regulator
VSTVQEIQDAITHLSEAQRLELMQWMYSRHELGSEDEAALIAEAEEGERQIKAGKFLTLEEARKQARTWTTK